MKTVTLCRHAKSSWKHPQMTDFERPLNKRGQRDAPVMAARLAQRSFSPDIIVSSPATRARTTALTVAEGIGFPVEAVLYDQQVYTSSAAALLALINSRDDSFSSLLLVGHNPACTNLANALGGLHLDNIPTCGVVSLQFAVPKWEDIGCGTGSLLFFDYPKNQHATA
ncbi:MAG: phosphohistidine phosphatase [Desulfobulbus propionicus]|nr:MAG: phosphohistidine phosphatase [Desulfobulbus propionicus]